MFFTNGAVFANLVPRYPQIKDDLDLGNGAYGAAIAAFPAGAVVFGLAAAPLVRRFGSARVATTGMILTGLGVLAAALSPSPWLFAGALFVAGAVDACTDVGQNAHGLRVQQAYGRSIINSLHAVWSVGAVFGGFMATAAIGLGIARSIHLTISAAVFSVVALVARRFSLPGADVSAETGEEVASGSEPSRMPGSRWRLIAVLAALVAMANAGSVVEDAGFSWAALYLSDDLGASSAVASIGFVALVGAQFMGRSVSDRLIDRHGQRRVVRAGGVLVTIGMGFALAVPSILGTIAGYGAAGFGIAAVVPAAMHAADELPGLRPGTGLAAVSWLMRIGFLCTPPLVGVISDATELRVALSLVPVAGLVIATLAGVLSSRRLR